jgi:hypothetical protein
MSAGQPSMQDRAQAVMDCYQLEKAIAFIYEEEE